MEFQDYKERQMKRRVARWPLLPVWGRMLSAENPVAEHKIPEEIVSAWKDAVSSKSKTAKNALFQAFLAAGKNWCQ